MISILAARLPCGLVQTILELDRAQALSETERVRFGQKSAPRPAFNGVHETHRGDSTPWSYGYGKNVGAAYAKIELRAVSTF